MRLRLRLEDVNLIEVPDEATLASFPIAEIMTAFHDAGLLDRADFAKPGDAKKPQAIASFEQLGKQARRWTVESCRIWAEDRDENDYRVDLSVPGDALSIQITLGGEWLSARRERILEDCVSAVARLDDALADRVRLGPTLQLEPIGVKYPRPRPPRLHQHFGQGTLIDMFSVAYHTDQELGDRDAISKLQAAKLPEGAVRQQLGDLLVLRWVDAGLLGDENELRKRLSQRDQWLSRTLGLPVAHDWNEAGDRRVPPPPLEKHPPLTFFHSGTRQGIKAVHVAPDGHDIEDALREPADWIAARALPDGTRLKSVSLILPDRARALLVEKRAREIGVAHVYYTSGDGSWWDPFPAGEWLSA